MTPDITADRDVLMLAVLGSTAYGLAHADSDLDRLGVFVAPTDEVLGLNGTQAVDQSVVTHNPDVSLHEVGKFCRLALKGNPTVSELLWAQRYEVLTETGAQLVEARQAFLWTSAVRSCYGGYALSQARQVRNQQLRTAKAARHAVRLLMQGTYLLTEGRLVLDVSEHREHLFTMGELAQTDPQAFLDRFEADLAAFDAVESVLPDRPDTERVERILVELRRAR
ncbi:nucleotidyltransferase domain-containing protein [Pseudactinotalea terrae]|uniref:nucleotidyltransferase domain-containing protein n=1 Tax=Pseudactinotalea terrae TaxID=1743262 RepID=UPI0012E261F1|nr:nucleotidyltransferase domain-containing protein [Pseudactinotalea terrae]